MSSSSYSLAGTIRALALTAATFSPLAAAQQTIEEIVVIGVTPGSAMSRDADQIPYNVQSTNAAALENSQALDLSDFMQNSLASVNINSAQNNPLQPDVQYRGFTASPLLGLPQGIAVYQNGVRINEPLGDSVNWDLLPESAVSSMDLTSGADPVFGLNTLGGALVINMKNGFNFTGTQIEASTGSWGRTQANFEQGQNFSLSNGSAWGYYLNLSHFEEDGWRDLSDSSASNFYGTLGWRNNERTSVDLIYQLGVSDLVGNGALPVGLMAIERDAIFTAPDITENDMSMVNIEASHFFSNAVMISGNIFSRSNSTDSFNGDGSEFESCTYSGGAQSLFEEADDIEDALEDELGIELDDICDEGDPSITSFAELEDFIEDEAIMAGLDPEDFELEDVINDLSGSGVITDEAINNISQRKQESEGFNAYITLTDDFFAADNQLVLGLSYFNGESEFDSVLELADLDPVTRSTEGLGVGTFFDEAVTNIDTQTKTWSLFFKDIWEVSDSLTLTLSGRYNDVEVTLRDRSGERPELNGDHEFSRFNPGLGFTYGVNDELTIYGSYSESNRVPTPIELACNEGVFELAREFAIADGEDPDDIEFECRLPNAFLADPFLEDVVTKSIEAGVRGTIGGIRYQAGVFTATNTDDILFQTTGRSTGLFANVDKTQRRGFESLLRGNNDKLDWYASYSFVSATFEDEFMVLSPNHPNANDDGELQVQNGDRLPGLPEHIFKLGSDYQLNEKLSLGMEVIYNSDQVIRGDESNDLDTVDGYALVNFRANYAFSSNFSVFARITNAFDTDYENFGLLGESPDEVLPSLADDRPLFLGVGAPRGAWLGLRYSF